MFVGLSRPKCFKNCVMFRFCSMSFCLAISDLIFRRLGLPNRGFRIEGIAKNECSWISFLKNFWIVFLCFVDALGAVFLTFQGLKTSLETKRFLTKSQIHHSGSGEADPRVFGPSKNIKA